MALCDIFYYSFFLELNLLESGDRLFLLLLLFGVKSLTLIYCLYNFLPLK